ncbi:MAG: calcium-binding protein [Paenirhodobacter sp.]|uniref:calcium-binding protein n=1 Tax=Paenirhodobacter sp. TaxID=1965326 RepID=UPI003D09F2D1
MDIYGTNASEVLTGTSGADLIYGGGGNDTINGSYGNDMLTGDGMDPQWNGSDDDAVRGGAGNDTLLSATGADTLWGELGNDQLGVSHDQVNAVDLYGGDGQDSLYAGLAGGVLDGGAGNDLIALVGADGADYAITLGTGDDVVQVFDGVGAVSATYTSGAFTATISDFNIYADTISLYGLFDETANAFGQPRGATGPEQFAISEVAGNAVLATPTGGQITLVGVSMEELITFTSMTFSNVTYNPMPGRPVSGTAGGDLIALEDGDALANGFGGDDTIFGGTGNDSFSGGEGNDLLYGGIGNDTIHGGAGDDMIDGGWSEDFIIADGGNDTIYGGLDHDFIMALDSSGSLWIDGGDALDEISVMHGTGDDTIFGGGGDDRITLFTEYDSAFTVTGGEGRDAIDIETASGTRVAGGYTVHVTDFTLGEDRVTWGAEQSASAARPFTLSEQGGSVMLETGEGACVVLDGVSLRALLETPEASRGILIAGLTEGTADDDRMVSAAGTDDVLSCGDGDDLANGGAGNDILLGGAGADTLGANAGDDTIDGGAGDDVIYGHKGNNLLLGGDGSDWISSGDQSSTLEGGAGDDILDLRMKAGGDHVASGGEGADTFVFSYLDARKQGDVTITDFEIGTDSLVIAGQSAEDYLASHAGATLADTGEGALLTLAEGDTILFAGLAAADLGAAFGAGDLLFA